MTTHSEVDTGRNASWLHRHGRVRKSLIGLILLVVLLIALRAALPEILQRYVNDKLDESPDYAGEVGDIDLALIRGAYSIDGIEIVKTEGDVPVPLFAAREVQFSLLWSALLDGSVVGRARLYEPVINIVDSENEANKQTGAEGQWLTIADDLFPLKIDEVLVYDGQLHFQNYETAPPVDIYLSQVDAEIINLSNSRDLSETMVSNVRLRALAMEEGELTAEMDFDPSLEYPTFDLDARLLSLPVLELDAFIDAYAPFDVEAGSVDVVTELAAKDGTLDGYVKPLISNLDVFRWKEDIEEDGDNPFKALWEGLVDFVGELLENQPHDQIATNIPISGPIDQPDTSAWAAIVNILRNAFVEALEANFDNTISLIFDGDDEEADAEGAPADESTSADEDESTDVDSPVNN